MKKQTIKEIKEALKGIDSENDYIKALRQDQRAGVQKALDQWDKRLAKKAQLIDAYHRQHHFENQAMDRGFHHIAGIDEVGRGPLAGPVVCAAVILDPNQPILGLKDSKKLSETKRLALYEEIYDKAKAVAVSQVSPEAIDDLNIYAATLKGMKEAVEGLVPQADYLLVDAMTIDTATAQESIIKGDAKSNSIAAASIIAKVTRDELMKEYSQTYPHYGFESNMGYGTKAHLEGLEKYGPTPIHRKSFEPVKSMVENK